MPRPRKLLSAVACAATGATLAGCPPREAKVTSLPPATFAAAAAPAPATPEPAVLDPGAPLCGPDGRPLPGNNRKFGCQIPQPAPKQAP